MTVPVANVANTNTFLFWQSITNQLAGLVSTAVITTDANSSSAQTPGNSAISGTFSANVLVCNTFQVNSLISVGNSTVNATINSTSFKLTNSTANIAITNPTATQISNGAYFLNANGQYALVVSSVIISNTVTLAGTSVQNVDTWSISTYRSAEYQINVFDNNANNHMALKILATHDTANPFITEFATITTNSAMGTFESSISGGNFVLTFQPVSTSDTIRYTRVAI
jgi:hypothetical protein